MKNCRLIEQGAAGAAVNMAVDEAVATACREGESPLTLRLYEWSPAALSIGYFQDTHQEVDLDRCKALGRTLVRRVTGGQAVLHDEELTYSLSARTDDPLFPKDLHGTFMTIAKGLISGLRLMDIRAEIMCHPDLPAAGTYQSSPSCFMTALGFEIGVAGKKLIGSAQRRWKDGFLQHGSILCTHHPERLVELLKWPSEEKKEEALAKLGQAATSLSEILGSKPDSHSLRVVVVKGMEETLGVRLIPGALSADEKELSRKLLEEKYGSDSWNLKRPRRSRPFFQVWSKTGHTDPERRKGGN